jgi:hypothetical protein
LRESENRVLRGVFGPKREEIVGGWRRLHNEELQNLYTSSNIITVITSMRMRWVGHVACVVEINIYNILIGKPEGKRPLGRSRSRWKDNVRMDLMDIGWEGVDWMHLAEDRNQWWALVNTVMNLQVQ